MKKLMALVLALMLALAAIPALGESVDYSGTWYINELGMTMGTFELNADGTVTSAMEGSDGPQNGTWAVTENGITIDDATGSVEFVYTDGNLVFEAAGMVLSREASKITPEVFSAYLNGELTELPEGVTEEDILAIVEAMGQLLAGAQEPTQYDNFVAAELESEVTVDVFVQATQSWWDDKITVYAQDTDGGYFIYNMACSKEDAEKLVPGTEIIVTGYKAEWAGEIEIIDATFTIPDSGMGFEAAPTDVTEFLGTDELEKYMNRLVSIKGLTVEAQDDGAAFNYKNAENKTDDLYVRFSKDGQIYNFCVEYYLCNEETDVYKAVEGLSVGDVVDVEGFLYWYNGPNTHLTNVVKAGE